MWVLHYRMVHTHSLKGFSSGDGTIHGVLQLRLMVLGCHHSDANTDVCALGPIVGLYSCSSTGDGTILVNL